MEASVNLGEWVRTPRVRVTLALALILLLLASYGPVTNDEMDQATAYHNLRHGSWKVEEFPSQHYKVPFLDFTVTFNIRNQVEYPIGSSMLNFLAIPVGIVLTGVDHVVPVSFLFAAVAVAVAYALTGWPAPWKGSATHRVLRIGCILAAFLLATWGLGMLPGAGQSPDLPYQEAYVALGTMNTILFVASCWLLWPVIRKRVDTDWAATVALLAVGLGPMLFWGESAKYHSLATFLVVLLLWLHDRPHTKWTLFGIGAAAGLSAWNHIGVGFVVIFGLVVSELWQAWRLRRTKAEIPRRWAPLALGGLVGLAPYFIENTYFFGNPFFSFYFADPAATAASNATANATAEAAGSGLFGSLAKIPDILLGIIGWAGPGDFVRNLAYGYVWSHAEGDPIPVLWLSPLLAGFLAYLVLAARRRRPIDGTLTFAIGLLVAQTIFYTNYGPKQGFGPDMRFYVHLLPALAVMAVMALGPGLSRTAPARLRILRGAVMLAIALILVTGLLTSALGEAFSFNSRLQLRGYFLSYAGILLGLSLFFYWMSRIRWIRPPPQKVAVVVLTVCISLVGLWNVFYMLSKPTSVAQEEQDEFASMVLPGMQPVAEFLKVHLFPEVNVPKLYDNGRIIYDPEYGKCERDPSPCPDHPNYRGETASP